MFLPLANPLQPHHSPQNRALSRPIVVALIIVGVLFLFLQQSLVSLVQAAEDAEEKPLQIRVIPSSTLSLATDRPTEVRVVVDNISADTLEDIELSSWADTGLDIAIESSSSLSELAPNTSHSWTVRLTPTPQLRLPITPLHFVVTYQRPHATDDSTTTPDFVTASLPLTLQASARPVAVKISTTLTSLNEHRPGYLYLVITNTSNFPLTLNRIETNTREYVTIKPLRVGKKGLHLRPGEVRILRSEVSATNQVQPGDALLLYTLTFTQQGAAEKPHIMVAAHRLTVGVLGESAVLDLIAIPLFFLVPGFLIIVGRRLMIHLITGKPASEVIGFKQWHPETIALSIAFSLIMSGVYPVVNNGRDYLVAYGLSDIMWVWLLSLGLGVVLHLLERLFLSHIERLRKWLGLEASAGKDVAKALRRPRNP